MAAQMGNSKSRTPRAPQISMSSREIVTRYQIDSLLQVLGMSSSALAHFLRISPEGEKLTPCETEARISIENTVRATCERMEAILKEESRWSMEFQVEAERKFTEAQNLNNELLAKQRDAAAEISSPHFRYRPTLLRLIDGSWGAFLGDIERMDQGVIGVGKTPQDAIEAFDDAWKGITNAKVLAWAKERESNLENGEDTKPFPQIKNENTETAVDPRKSEKTEDPPSGGAEQC